MGDGGRIDQRVHRPSVHRFLLFLCGNRRLHGHEPLPQRQLRRQSSQGSSSKSGHRVRASRGAPGAEARRGHTRSVFSRTSNGGNKNSEYSAIKSSKKRRLPRSDSKNRTLLICISECNLVCRRFSAQDQTTKDTMAVHSFHEYHECHIYELFQNEIFMIIKK